MRLFTAIFLLFFFLSPSVASAHIRGMPIMKINGENTKVYPAQVSTSVVFDVPSDADIGASPYVKGEKLTFVIDPTNLPFPKEILEKTLFTWDFGDGSKPQKIKGGLENIHTYKKIDTLIMIVTADYTAAGLEDLGLQQVQATVLTIVPTKQYVLPKAVITVNDTVTSEKEGFGVDLNHAVTFAVDSVQGQEPISYIWDFGDGVTSTQKRISYRYRLPQYYATPMVRIQDANGIFSDTFVTIRNTGKNDPNNPELEAFLWNSAKILGGVLLGIYIYIFYRKRKKKIYCFLHVC